MNALGGCNPFISLLFFATFIGFSMFLNNPLAMAISAFCAVAYRAFLGKLTKRGLAVFLAAFFAAAINPLFNHRGTVILAYFPNGNALTLESVLYGLSAGGVVIQSVFWFANMSDLMTSDKYIYVFSGVSPSVSLMLSSALGFAPKFNRMLKKMLAYRLVGEERGKAKRFKAAVSVFFSAFYQSLDVAVCMAEEMKNRGFGCGKRTFGGKYPFEKRDTRMLAFYAGCFFYIILGVKNGAFEFKYFPYIKFAPLTLYGASVYAVYFIFMLSPLIMDVAAELKWRKVASGLKS